MKTLSKLCSTGVSTALLMTVIPGWSATYFINTDDHNNEDVFFSVGATNGYNTSGLFFLGPTRPGTINGVALNFGGYTNSTALFGLAGDLNLGSNDRILAFGSRFLKIEVGGNATIPAGAVV